MITLTLLGLTVGAVFLIVLLNGDRREARKKARQEQMAEASREREGVWPPPPNRSSGAK